MLSSIFILPSMLFLIAFNAILSSIRLWFVALSKAITSPNAYMSIAVTSDTPNIKADHAYLYKGISPKLMPTIRAAIVPPKPI